MDVMKEIKRTHDREGWLIPYLIMLDHKYFQRWDYWSKAVLLDKIPKDPIPVVPFRASHVYQQKQVINNLNKCLSYAENRYTNPLNKFIDWILWGLNQGDSFPSIDEKTDDFWYRTFNLGLFYEEPADHFADIACEHCVGKYSGYFPTPGPVTELMVRMNFGGEPTHQHKRMSVCDPCCGTGVMLLYASNYSLNLYGIDINPLLTKIAKVNAYIYVPWLAYRPQELTMFDKVHQRDAIVEIERPTGIKIPKCTRCNNESEFLVELKTDHELSVNPLGFFNVQQPTISSDLIAQKLTPEHITCARCFREEDSLP